IRDFHVTGVQTCALPIWRLSGNVEVDQLEGVRDVVQDPEKRDPRDFALWKKDPSHLMQWHSPWGWGFPGWHIECSAMSMAYLGRSEERRVGKGGRWRGGP